jgi:molybdopterin/thiamine biosynthesis adenylyltransferase
MTIGSIMPMGWMRKDRGKLKSMRSYDYDVAFSRNIGWVTRAEQSLLKDKRVAIAGMGGVGGSHLMTLARLGVGKFRIADPDCFELGNFNRQAGASIASLGRPKAEVLTALVRGVNPECEIETLSGGVTPENVADFFEKTDLYVDGLDFFAFEARRLVFGYCFANDIPAVTVAPLGMSAAMLNFLPGHMSFEAYFQWGDRPELEKAVRFLVGLAPALLHRHYLADPTQVDLRARKGPSTNMACQLCAGIAGTEALKILLDRGRVLAAPHGFQFDAYRYRLVHTWRPGGNGHPINRLAIAGVKRLLGI